MHLIHQHFSFKVNFAFLFDSQTFVYYDKNQVDPFFLVFQSLITCLRNERMILTAALDQSLRMKREMRTASIFISVAVNATRRFRCKTGVTIHT